MYLTTKRTRINCAVLAAYISLDKKLKAPRRALLSSLSLLYTKTAPYGRLTVKATLISLHVENRRDSHKIGFRASGSVYEATSPYNTINIKNDQNSGASQ